MKQTCEHMSRLHLLKDGELDNGDQGWLLNHLGECEACRAEWVALTRLSRMMRNLDEVAPGPGFDQAFRDRVEAYERKRPARLLTWLFISPLKRVMIPAAAVLVLGAGLYTAVNTVKPYSDEMTLSDQIDLLEDFDVVDNLDLLENWDAINRMKVET